MVPCGLELSQAEQQSWVCLTIYSSVPQDGHSWITVTLYVEKTFKVSCYSSSHFGVNLPRESILSSSFQYISINFIILKFYFFSVCVCVSVFHCGRVVEDGLQKLEKGVSLGSNSKPGVTDSYDVLHLGGANSTRVLCKYSKCSYLMRHLYRSPFLLIL